MGERFAKDFNEVFTEFILALSQECRKRGDIETATGILEANSDMFLNISEKEQETPEEVEEHWRKCEERLKKKGLWTDK